MGVRRRRTAALIATTTLIAAAALAGCSSGDSGPASTQAQPAAGTPADPAADAAAAAPGQGPPAQSPELRVDQRAIVYTGSITVQVPDVAQAAAQVTTIATGAGGFVGADNRNRTTGAADASLELRVPAAKFQAVVDQLAGLGTEQARTLSTDDVTEETIDLDARIATQQARVDSGRRLLARATSLADLVMLEGELAKREADLASLTGKKRRLADLTALSTITAVLRDTETVGRGDDGPAGFLGGLERGWQALVASFAVLVTLLGAVLPWLVAVGIPAWGAVWAFRRVAHRRSRATMSAMGDPAFATPTGHSPTGHSPASAPLAEQPTPDRPSAP